jgi:ankyrin repeat protein
MPPDVGVRPAKANKAFWRKVLFAAADIGDDGIVGSVLAAGLASPDSSDPRSGDTALMHAAQHGNADMVQYLLDARATADQANNDCLTALGVATIAGQSQVVSTLMKNGFFPLSSRDHNRQYTLEQELRIQQADLALDNALRRDKGATKPAFVPRTTSDTHDMNGPELAERQGGGKTSRVQEQARQAKPDQ